MRKVVSEDAVDSVDAAGDDAIAAQIRESLDGQYVCPFCGSLSESPEGICARCSMENTSAARKATKSRIGPWFVYQHRNPAAPGMQFETLLGFVQKGKIKPRTIVRGPTTHQLWRFAAHVKGLSREFGVCFNCGGAIKPGDNLCPHCNKLQEPPINPDVLLESEPDAGRVSSAPSARPASPAPPRAAAAFRGPDAQSKVDPEDETDTAPPRQFRSAYENSPKQPMRETYLSPRELAAAFNLDFTPEKEPRHRHEPRRPDRHRRRKSRKGLSLLLFIIVLAGAVVALAVKRPDLRVKTQNWAMDMLRKMQPAGSDRTAMTGSVRQQHELRAPTPTATVPTKVASLPAAPHMPTTQPSTQPARVQVSAPAHIDPPQTRPTDAVLITHKVNPATAPSEAVVQAPPEPVEVDLVAAAEKAKELYSAAIDAEQRVDFKAAVSFYQQVMKLPRDTWPTDLEIRLKLAKHQAEEQ